MNRVFVDTGGFYASLNRRDAYHHDAVRLFTQAQREQWFLFTTNFILAESHALILTRMGRDRALGKAEGLHLPAKPTAGQDRCFMTISRQRLKDIAAKLDGESITPTSLKPMQHSG